MIKVHYSTYNTSYHFIFTLIFFSLGRRGRKRERKNSRKQEGKAWNEGGKGREGLCGTIL
jgi:hypothetical protein